MYALEKASVFDGAFKQSNYIGKKKKIWPTEHLNAFFFDWQ